MSQCAQCTAQFSCGMVDRNDPPDSAQEGAPCWCTALPPLLGVPLEGSCLCPNCLQERLLQIQQGRDQPDAL